MDIYEIHQFLIRHWFLLTMMLAFHLAVVLVHTAALAAAAGTSSNAESELSLTAVSGLNPEETSRFVLQCDATTEGSQTVGIIRGSQQVSWNGQLTSDFVRSLARQNCMSSSPCARLAFVCPAMLNVCVCPCASMCVCRDQSVADLALFPGLVHVRGLHSRVSCPPGF